MKNKLLMYLLMFILVISFASCSKNNSSTDSESKAIIESDNETDAKNIDETTKETAKPAVKLSDNLFDTEFSINGEVFKLPLWYADFNAKGLIAKNDSEVKLFSQGAEHFNWTLDNIDLQGYLYNGSINALPINQCIMQVFKITSHDTDDKNEILFCKNIQLNVSTKNDIIAAYGEPTKTYENANDTRLFYQSEETSYINIFFLLDKNTNILIGATITNSTYVEFDNTVSSEKELSFDYIAPSKLSDQFDNKVFMINDQYYSLPCPVSEFINNGFYISDYDKEYNIPAGRYHSCEFELNEKTMFVYVTNFSETACPLINCHVTRIICDTLPDGDVLIVEFSPGIKLGDSEDKLITALADTKYVVSKSDDLTFYFLEESDAQDMLEYSIRSEFFIKDDAIIHIDFCNDKIQTYE